MAASRSKIQDEEEDDYVPNPNSEKADEMSAGHAPLALFQGATTSVCVFSVFNRDTAGTRDAGWIADE
jgi:hypothetical protein